MLLVMDRSLLNHTPQVVGRPRGDCPHTPRGVLRLVLAVTSESLNCFHMHERKQQGCKGEHKNLMQLAGPDRLTNDLILAVHKT